MHVHAASEALIRRDYGRGRIPQKPMQRSYLQSPKRSSSQEARGTNLILSQSSPTPAYSTVYSLQHFRALSFAHEQAQSRTPSINSMLTSSSSGVRGHSTARIALQTSRERISRDASGMRVSLASPTKPPSLDCDMRKDREGPRGAEIKQMKTTISGR